jgi:hypothetical protein
MIRGYSDHAANERTFLAWLRTSIAVIAFGFVIEKFNIFVLTLLNAASVDEAARSRLEKLSGPFPEGAGRRVHHCRCDFYCRCDRPLCSNGTPAGRPGDSFARDSSRSDIFRSCSLCC